MGLSAQQLQNLSHYVINSEKEDAKKKEEGGNSNSMFKSVSQLNIILTHKLSESEVCSSSGCPQSKCNLLLSDSDPLVRVNPSVDFQNRHQADKAQTSCLARRIWQNTFIGYDQTGTQG